MAVGSRYQKTGDGKAEEEYLVRTVVNRRLCRSILVDAINAVTNPWQSCRQSYISYDVGFNPSTQRHYRRLIYYLCV
jgi:hypothetical protein